MNKNKKMGRPKFIIDDKMFDTAIQLPLIKSDICSLVGNCSEDTLERYCKQRFGLRFAELQEQKRQNFRKNILGKQYELAMKGDRVMLIWLGKQYLGQREKQEIVGDAEQPLTISYLPRSKRELIE